MVDSGKKCCSRRHPARPAYMPNIKNPTTFVQVGKELQDNDSPNSFPTPNTLIKNVIFGIYQTSPEVRMKKKNAPKGALSYRAASNCLFISSAFPLTKAASNRCSFLRFAMFSTSRLNHSCTTNCCADR